VLLDDHVFPDLTRNNTIIKFYKARSISVVNNFFSGFFDFYVRPCISKSAPSYFF